MVVQALEIAKVTSLPFRLVPASRWRAYQPPPGGIPALRLGAGRRLLDIRRGAGWTAHVHRRMRAVGWVRTLGLKPSVSRLSGREFSKFGTVRPRVQIPDAMVCPRGDRALNLLPATPDAFFERHSSPSESLVSRLKAGQISGSMRVNADHGFRAVTTIRVCRSSSGRPAAVREATSRNRRRS